MNPNQRVSRNHFIKRIRNENIYSDSPNKKQNISYIVSDNNRKDLNQNYQNDNSYYKSVQIKRKMEDVNEDMNRQKKMNSIDFNYPNLYSNMSERNSTPNIIYGNIEKIENNNFNNNNYYTLEKNFVIKKANTNFYSFQNPKIKKIKIIDTFVDKNLKSSPPKSIYIHTDINEFSDEENENRIRYLNRYQIPYKRKSNIISNSYLNDSDNINTNNFYEEGINYNKNKIIKKMSYNKKYNAGKYSIDYNNDNIIYDLNEINNHNHKLNNTPDYHSNQILENNQDKNQIIKKFNKRRAKFKIIKNIPNSKIINNTEIIDDNYYQNKIIQSEKKEEKRFTRRMIDKKKLMNNFQNYSSKEIKIQQNEKNSFYNDNLQNKIKKLNDNALIKKVKYYRNRYSNNKSNSVSLDQNNSILMNKRIINPNNNLCENENDLKEKGNKINKEFNDINQINEVKNINRNIIFKNIQENSKNISYNKDIIERIKTYSKRISYDFAQNKNNNIIIKNQQSINNKKIIPKNNKDNNKKYNSKFINKNEVIKNTNNIKKEKKVKDISKFEICNVSNVIISGGNDKNNNINNNRNIIIIINNNENNKPQKTSAVKNFENNSIPNLNLKENNSISNAQDINIGVNSNLNINENKKNNIYNKIIKNKNNNLNINNVVNINIIKGNEINYDKKTNKDNKDILNMKEKKNNNLNKDINIKNELINQNKNDNINNNIKNKIDDINNNKEKNININNHYKNIINSNTNKFVCQNIIHFQTGGQKEMENNIIPQASININFLQNKKDNNINENKDINDTKLKKDNEKKQTNLEDPNNDKKPNYNNNDFVNEKNEELKSVIQYKIERRRPVYALPPSQKRSASQGKPFNLINKYYDENFILEDDNEEENIKLSDDSFEEKGNNIDILNSKNSKKNLDILINKYLNKEKNEREKNVKEKQNNDDEN